MQTSEKYSAFNAGGSSVHSLKLRQLRRQFIGAILIAMFVLTVCQSSVRGFGSGRTSVMNRKPLTTGQQNIVKRAYQMTNISWTPLRDIVGWNNELVYKVGTTYTGLPYGQPVHASYVPWSTSLVNYLDAVNDSTSKMYTSYSTYNSRAPYYSTDCSAFVSWAWGLSSRQSTSTLHNFATQISTTSFEKAQVGDCLCLARNHVVLITDITYDDNDVINSIEISESTVSSLNYCCHKVRYGVGGTHTLDDLSKKYFNNGYILYRSKTRENVSYYHSCAVPLEGDICTACGLGAFNEIPAEFVVVGLEEVTLYALPNIEADQLGIIYAGNEIAIIAYCEDDYGVLWYRTSDNEWILAEKTKLSCSHQYTYSITLVPSCTKDGMAVYTCTLCGDSYTQTLQATQHSYEVTVISPGCETGGYEQHYCYRCGDTYRTGETSAIGHWYEKGICKNCGAADPEVRKGDINEDGDVTSADTVLLVRYLAGLQTLSANQLKKADVNSDGEITSADSVKLARYLAGLSEIN